MATRRGGPSDVSAAVTPPYVTGRRGAGLAEGRGLGALCGAAGRAPPRGAAVEGRRSRVRILDASTRGSWPVHSKFHFDLQPLASSHYDDLSPQLRIRASFLLWHDGKNATFSLVESSIALILYS